MRRASSQILVHYLFSTLNQRKWITSDLQPRLWVKLGKIARENSMHALAIGGTDDHVHLLLAIPSEITIAAAVQQLKEKSLVWIYQQFPLYRYFSWQKGYGAFSVSVSQKDTVVEYIKQQELHHRSFTFQQELIGLLKKHRVIFDERKVLR